MKNTLKIIAFCFIIFVFPFFLGFSMGMSLSRPLNIQNQWVDKANKYELKSKELEREITRIKLESDKSEDPLKDKISELESHVNICGQQINNLYYITDVLSRKIL